MRRIALFAFSALLITAVPASAKDDFSIGRNFGTTNCRGTVTCPNAATSENYVAIIKSIFDHANYCVNAGFGKISRDGFFEEGAGINVKGCLTPKLPSERPKMGALVRPTCCLSPVEGNPTQCSMRCTMNEIGR